MNIFLFRVLSLIGILSLPSSVIAAAEVAAAEVVAAAAGSVSCLDENGQPVDSWTVLKAAPYTFDYYVYNETISSWSKSIYTTSQDVNGCIMRTMSQVYAYSNSYDAFAMGMYNDDPPGPYTASSSYAHAKGILMTSSTQGFWLIHSMPNWPNNETTGYPGPFPDDTYGQSLQCVTIAAATANVIASNLMIDHPYIYSKNISSSLTTTLPQFANWLSAKTTKLTNATVPFKSMGGKTFYQMAKSASWNKDLWDDLVAPYFQVQIDVETWRNGAGGRMSSICGTNGSKAYEAYDVYTVSRVDMPKGGMSWNGTQDHSKWASAIKVGVTNSGGSDSQSSWGSNVTCVGDINRMCSQEKRGGGAMCTIDNNLWSAFNNAIGGVEGCYQYNPCASAGGTSTQCYWCTTSSPTALPTIAVLSPSPSPTSAPSPTPTSSSNSNGMSGKDGLSNSVLLVAIIVPVGLVLIGLVLFLFYAKNKWNLDVFPCFSGEDRASKYSNAGVSFSYPKNNAVNKEALLGVGDASQDTDSSVNPLYQKKHNKATVLTSVDE